MPSAVGCIKFGRIDFSVCRPDERQQLKLGCVLQVYITHMLARSSVIENTFGVGREGSSQNFLRD